MREERQLREFGWDMIPGDARVVFEEDQKAIDEAGRAAETAAQAPLKEKTTETETANCKFFCAAGPRLRGLRPDRKPPRSHHTLLLRS